MDCYLSVFLNDLFSKTMFFKCLTWNTIENCSRLSGFYGHGWVYFLFDVFGPHDLQDSETRHPFSFICRTYFIRLDIVC